MIAVDSSVWIDFIAGRPKPQSLLLKNYLSRSPSQIALIDLVFTEVMRGLPDKDIPRIEATLLELPVFRMEWVRDFRAAAGLYRAARNSGVTIRSTVDCLIAAVCIREGASLLHTDIDFDRLSEISELATIKVG
jgi:hypothetical protein